MIIGAHEPLKQATRRTSPMWIFKNPMWIFGTKINLSYAALTLGWSSAKRME
jgi:hypothetical protein